MPTHGRLIDDMAVYMALDLGLEMQQRAVESQRPVLKLLHVGNNRV